MDQFKYSLHLLKLPETTLTNNLTNLACHYILFVSFCADFMHDKSQFPGPKL